MSVASRSSGSENPDGPVRRPQSVYGVGEDPDVRFSLANERTALAWLRTGLGLVAGGVALTSLASIAELHMMIDIVAVVACLAGGTVAIYSMLTWRRNERALRLDAPLPSPVMLPVLVTGIVVMALLLAGFTVAQIL